ncbi:MAG: bifunctional lysylphosphatidylglycerol flippase/synthetase MprF, partial [Candidatus Binatia bacterium]
VAWQLAMGLLSSGIVFSLLKGFDYEEALILSIMLLVLWPCRASFYRTASLVSERFSPGWITAIAIVLLGSTWLGVFAHKHTEYASELWWHFALSADAPRSMRATVGALSGALILAALHLLRPAPPSPTVPDRATLDRARQVIAHSRATEANLALAGDKSLLFSDTGNTFIMYGVEGRSWVALGDPIGPKEEQRELAWQFQELCDYHNGWAVFYEVGTKNLPLYLELGLTLLKIGEGARVRLDTFSIKGDSGRKHRHALNRVEKTGVRFSIVPVSQVQPLLPQLRAVSDAWLTEKNTREKGFSLGFFDESYLCEFPLAVIYQESQLIAFANVWLGAEKEELSVDLMRHLPEAPPGVMDYLFLQLMLWGQKEGYGWFNLGMAPFSGFESRALAPLWTRLGALLFRHGEHFYNFQGLRQYKEKFDPEWEPRYLASPGGLALPRILTNLATLISGGFRGLLTK